MLIVRMSHLLGALNRRAITRRPGLRGLQSAISLCKKVEGGKEMKSDEEVASAEKFESGEEVKSSKEVKSADKKAQPASNAARIDTEQRSEKAKDTPAKTGASSIDTVQRSQKAKDTPAKIRGMGKEEVQSGRTDKAVGRKDSSPVPSPDVLRKRRPIRDRDPIWCKYRYSLQTVDTRQWLVEELIRRAMCSALRSRGTLMKGASISRVNERVWNVNKSPFVHSKSKDHYIMRTTSYYDVLDTIEEPQLRNSGFKIAERLPGYVAVKAQRTAPAFLSVPDMYLTIQRRRFGAKKQPTRLKQAGEWKLPPEDAAQTVAEKAVAKE